MVSKVESEAALAESDHLRAAGVATVMLTRLIPRTGDWHFIASAGSPDVFNPLNQSAITGRNLSAQFASPATSTIITILPYDANGNLIPSLSLPKKRPAGLRAKPWQPQDSYSGVSSWARHIDLPYVPRYRELGPDDTPQPKRRSAQCGRSGNPCEALSQVSPLSKLT